MSCKEDILQAQIQRDNSSLPSRDSILPKLINASASSSVSLSDIETTPRHKLPLVNKKKYYATTNIYSSHVEDQSLASPLEYPTAFHLALNSSGSNSNDYTNLECLRIHLLAQPSSCSIKDCYGRLPLHLLSQNAKLLLEESKDELEEFIMDVFNEYPLAAIISDKNGKVPFSYSIFGWTPLVMEQAQTLHEDNNIISDQSRNNLSTSGNQTRNSLLDAQYYRSDDSFNKVWSDPQNMFFPDHHAFDNDDNISLQQKHNITPKIIIWNWYMLEKIYHKIIYETSSANSDFLQRFISNLCSALPNLFPSAFFIPNLTELEVLQQCIVYSTYNHVSVDQIACLFDDDGTRFIKGIRYLGILEEYIYHFETKASSELFLDSTLVSRLLNLNRQSNLEDIYENLVIVRTIKNALASEDEIENLVCVDFIFHLIFLTAIYSHLYFLSSLSLSSFRGSASGDERLLVAALSACFILVCIFYFLIRKVHQLIFFWKASRYCRVNIFLRNSFQLQDICEWMMIILILVLLLSLDEIKENDLYYKIVPFTILFVWMNFLGWLGNVNTEVSMFLRNLYKALTKIKMHLVLFCIMIIYSCQMFQLLLVFGPCSSSQDNKAIPCTTLSLMHTYSIALGRFVFSHYNLFTTSTLNKIAFICFTITVTILLSAIIIPTVIQTTLPSLSSGKVRIKIKSQFLYYAHTSSLKELLLSQWSCFQCCNAFFIFVGISILIYALFIMKTGSIERRGIDELHKYLVILGFIGLIIFILISISMFVYYKTSYVVHKKVIEKGNGKTINYSRKLLGLFLFPFKFFIEKTILLDNESNIYCSTPDHIMTDNSELFREFQRKSLQKVMDEIKNNIDILLLRHNSMLMHTSSNYDIVSMMEETKRKIEDLRLMILQKIKRQDTSFDSIVSDVTGEI